MDPEPPDVAPGAELSASTLAGLLLLARSSMAHLGLPNPSITDILDATGARSSQAYARRRALLHLAMDSERKIGRPRAEAQPAITAAITRRVLRYLMDNPGAVCPSGPRYRYSGEFRQLVVTLQAEYPNLDLGSLAEAVQVPLPSLRAWLSGKRVGQPVPARCPARMPEPGIVTAVIRAWLAWSGSFTHFCDHVQRDMGVPWKRTLVAGILADCGLRAPRTRMGRPRPEPGSRGAFETFFPGAQWVTDGKQLTLHINGHPFTFNLQLVVDTDSGALVGASLRDQEDSRAVLDAFADAVATAGEPPLALLLDNRQCNHSAQVARLAASTTLIHAAKGRPQTKGHVEGAFGLFSQAMPQLEIRADSLRELAQQFLRILVQGWARALNCRPRRDRYGDSRVQLYHNASSTPEERDAARARLCGRAVRAARRRQPAPGNEAMHAFLVDWLERLAIPGIDDATVAALCQRPLDAVLAGLAIYEGKRMAKTLPGEAGNTYLLGIVRNLAENDEGLRIADALWRVRVAARNHLQEALDARVRAAVAQEPSAGADIDAITDEAMAASNPCERRLWLMAAARALRGLHADHRRRLYRRIARRIHASPGVPYAQQLEAVRFLATDILPVP